MTDIDAQKKLCELLQNRQGALKIALSGGIDSITLMTVAARVRGSSTVAVHAISAAVPEEATDRCRALASKYGWPLEEIDAGEFENKSYIKNPVNRCYYCKSSLFDRIIQSADTELLVPGAYTIATGTNTDDLGDYRPGLLAAKERRVWQPYVEAGIDKQTLRRIARQEGLGELSDLPAQPCLSSRVETGIAINARDLRFIHQVEKAITSLTSAGDIRCRINKTGVTVQLPPDNEILVNRDTRLSAEQIVARLCENEGRHFSGFELYKMGSAFLKESPLRYSDV